MDTATVFGEMDKLPKDQRIQFAMEVWEHALGTGAAPDLIPEQEEELQSRVAELDANPEDVFSWKETKHYLRRPN
jgi:hypothetical protein